jgi:hypothetical protein
VKKGGQNEKEVPYPYEVELPRGGHDGITELEVREQGVLTLKAELSGKARAPEMRYELSANEQGPRQMCCIVFINARVSSIGRLIHEV